MKKRLIIALVILILFTTISSKQKIVISKFNLKEIIIYNNSLLKDEDLKKLLLPIYNKNLLLLKNAEIKKLLFDESFIESFKIKKKYPKTLKIEIFEKKPIAILLNKKGKFYVSEKIDLIEFKKLPKYKNLPYILGDIEKFEILFNNLNSINFPLEKINKYILFETKRWDLITENKKIIKLPPKNYIMSLKNYLEIENKNGFKKFKVFDYRINSQLILK